MAKKYEIKSGKFGMFFYDAESKIDLSLAVVLEKLNRIEGYKARLANVNKIHRKPLGKEW